MPIYEFICESCGNEFEQIRSFSDSAMPACTKCGSLQVVRRMGRPAIHFKGSGWYINDSKKSSENKGGASKSSGENVKSESVTETATESKSESKNESKNDNKSESKTETKSDSATESKSAPAPVVSSD